MLKNSFKMPTWFFVLLLVIGASQAQEGVKGGRHSYNRELLQSGSHTAHLNSSEEYLAQSHNRSRLVPTLLHNIGFNVRNTTDYFGPIPSGICYQEVPTRSLVRDPNLPVPVGNGSSSSLSRVQVCCDGFARNPHVFTKCDPVCEPECVNAKCVGPNKCTCYPDHVRDLGGNCVPTCPIGCLNGVCYGDRCACHEGYSPDESGRFCIPKCSRGCPNGNCTAPERCSCKEGYKYSESNQCVPHCTNCRNGDCVGPEECRCHRGYAKEENLCEPQCPRGCLHGYCAAPDICACSYGMQLDQTGTTCLAHCSTPCLNGDCTGPDTCTCKRGYTKDPQDPTGTKCIGYCPTGCPNGVCSGPNFCICNVGYVKDRSLKGSQACVRRARRSIFGQ